MAMTESEIGLTATVAANIRSHMARQRVSQLELARRLGFSQSKVSRRLSGDFPITVDELESFARVLGITVADLLHGTVPAIAA